MNTKPDVSGIGGIVGTTCGDPLEPTIDISHLSTGGNILRVNNYDTTVSRSIMKKIDEHAIEHNQSNLSDMCFNVASIFAKEAMGNDSVPGKVLNGVLAVGMGAVGVASRGVGKVFDMVGSAVTSGTATIVSWAVEHDLISKDDINRII